MGGMSDRRAVELSVRTEDADTAAWPDAGAADDWLRKTPPIIAVTRTDFIYAHLEVGKIWLDISFDGVETLPVACRISI
jgi:hypothetical protein